MADQRDEYPAADEGNPATERYEEKTRKGAQRPNARGCRTGRKWRGAERVRRPSWGRAEAVVTDGGSEVSCWAVNGAEGGHDRAAEERPTAPAVEELDEAWRQELLSHHAPVYVGRFWRWHGQESPRLCRHSL